MIDHHRASEVCFVLYDFFENVQSAEKKNLLSVNELIERLNNVNKMANFLSNRRPQLILPSSLTKDEKEKFNETLLCLREYKQMGEQLVKVKLLSLFSYPNSFIDKAILTEAIDLLHSRWRYQIDGITNKKEGEIHIRHYYDEFSRLVDFVHDVFSIHPKYLQNKKSSNRLLMWEFSSVKQTQMNIIEKALIQAMKIATVDLTYDVIQVLIPVLKKGSEEINKKMFGKSALSNAIDAVVSNFDSSKNYQLKK